MVSFLYQFAHNFTSASCIELVIMSTNGHFINIKPTKNQENRLHTFRVIAHNVFGGQWLVLGHYNKEHVLYPKTNAIFSKKVFQQQMCFKNIK